MHVVTGLVGRSPPKVGNERSAGITDAAAVLVVAGAPTTSHGCRCAMRPRCTCWPRDQLNTYDVLINDDIVFTQAALEQFLSGPRMSARPQPPPRRSRLPPGDRDRGRPSRPTLKRVRMRIADHRDVLLGPVISEKAYGLLDENKYTFLVRPDANKTEIKIAVEGLRREGDRCEHPQPRWQARAHRAGFGHRALPRSDAVVTVAEGDRIDIFGGPVS